MLGRRRGIAPAFIFKRVSCVLCPGLYKVIDGQDPRTLICHPCRNSTAMQNSFSSPTVSLRDLMNGPLSIISHHLGRSASLQERIMLMEVLISTLSSHSRGSFDPDEPISLMLTAATRTLSHLEATRAAATITQSNMERSSQEGSSVLAEVEFLRLQLRGIGLSQLQVLENFASLFENWRRRRLSSGTARSNHSSLLSSPRNARPTFIPAGSNLSWEWYLSWMHGEETLLQLLDLKVRCSSATGPIDLV